MHYQIQRGPGARPRRALGAAWPSTCLFTNVDDHVQNDGFLHVAHGQWRLAPAFDVNPFPDKDPELKLWLNENYGPVDSIEAVVAEAGSFRMSEVEAKRILARVYHAVRDWKTIARSASVGMTDDDLDAFEPAFGNSQMEATAALLG